MIVADASVVFDALRGITRARERIDGEELAAPHLIDLEVTSSLRSGMTTLGIKPDQAHRILRKLADMPVKRFEHTDFLPRIWELRHNITPYDAVYVVLTEQLDVPLLTVDRKLANAPGLTVTIEVLAV